jgi:hypothetical protein
MAAALSAGTLMPFFVMDPPPLVIASSPDVRPALTETPALLPACPL